MEKKKRKWLPSLAIAIAIPQLAGILGGVATSSSIKTWYRRLNKPTWNPPSNIFAPVWTTLYLFMGIASWLVWRRSKQNGIAAQQAPKALSFYGIQLALNTLWSVIFFGAHQVDLALGELLLLWSFIAQTAINFYRIHPIAGWLLAPYLLWTSFAGALNGAILWLNRDQEDIRFLKSKG